MVEPGDDSRLAFEAIASRLIGRDVRQQHFDGNRAVEPCVARAIDLAHAAAADTGVETVRPELHALEILAAEGRDRGRISALQEIVSLGVGDEEGRHFPAKGFVARAGLRDEGAALVCGQRQGAVEHLSHSLPRLEPW